MSLLINADTHLSAEKQLNVYLRSVTAAKHALTLFNSTLLDAIALYDNPNETADDSQNLHADINVNTHSAFSMDANCTQFEQQVRLSRLLGKGEYADFGLLNALYQAPLAVKNAPESIPQEVLDNMPWSAREKLQPSTNERMNQPKNAVDVTSPSSVLEILEASRAFNTDIGEQ